MKSGKKSLIIFSMSILALAIVSIKNKKRKLPKPTVYQYENRLEEFCLFDVDQAKSEFHSFLELGFNPSDAFELTIIKRVYV
jgi:hypothetical protein